MSFIYRDTLTPARAEWAAASKVFHTFDKVWPKDNVVYSERLYFYRAKRYQESERLSRFLAALGTSWEAISSEPIDDEIDDVWFKINPEYQWDGSFAGDSRANPERSTDNTTQLVAPTAYELAKMFNERFEKDEEVTVTVRYGGATRRYINDHKLDWAINETGIIQTAEVDTAKIREVLESDPWYYLGNIRFVDMNDSNKFQYYDGANIDAPGKNHPLRSTSRFVGTSQTMTDSDPMAMFAFMPGAPFERVDGPFSEKISTEYSAQYDGEVLTYTYSQKFKFTEAHEDMQCIKDMVKYYENKAKFKVGGRIAYSDAGQYRNSLTYKTKDTSIKKVLNSLQLYYDPATDATTEHPTNSLFLNGRLRVYEARMMRRNDFILMLADCMDTDYKVEEASFWEKLLAVVIVIVAVFVGIYTGGIGLTGLATGLGNATIVLGVGAMLLSAVGGLSAQGLVKLIGNVAQIIGYAAAFAGVMAALESQIKSVATKQLIDSGTPVTDQTLQSAMEEVRIVDLVADRLQSSLSSLTDKLSNAFTGSFTDLVSTVSDGLELVNKALNDKKDKEAKEIQAEYDKLREMEDEYNHDILNKQLMHPAALYVQMNDRIYGWDGISELDLQHENTIGKDKNFLVWYGNVNSV